MLRGTKVNDRTYLYSETRVSLDGHEWVIVKAGKRVPKYPYVQEVEWYVGEDGIYAQVKAA